MPADCSPGILHPTFPFVLGLYMRVVPLGRNRQEAADDVCYREEHPVGLLQHSTYSSVLKE